MFKRWNFFIGAIFSCYFSSLSYAEEFINQFEYDQLGRLITHQRVSEERKYFLDSMSNINLVSFGKHNTNGNTLQFSVLKPKNNSVLDFDLRVRFSWSKVSDAIAYTIWIGREKNDLTIFKNGILGDFVLLDLSYIKDTKPIYWKVTAILPNQTKISSNVYTLSALDSDFDLLPDHIEALLCTSNKERDSDGDGIDDGQEINIAEFIRYNSFPCLKDSDQDGMEDAFEKDFNSDPMVVDSHLNDMWLKYVDWIAKKHKEDNVPVVAKERFLNLKNNQGYAISGFVPGTCSLTIAYWTKLTPVENLVQTIGSHDDGNRRYYIGFDKDNKLIIGIGSDHRSSRNVTDIKDKWIHLALSYNQEKRSALAYINGNMVLSEDYIDFKSKSNYLLWFGARNQKKSWEPEYINGYMDNLSVWSKELDSQFIQRLMFNKPDLSDEKLLAFYDFSESRNEWVKNKATEKFDLKLVNGAVLSDELEHVDSDRDGIADEFEFSLCTQADLADSDNDGLLDGEEFGIGAGVEYLTNPCSSDTDSDGIDDWFEIKQKFNPTAHDVVQLDESTGKTHWDLFSEYSLDKDSKHSVINANRVLDLSEGNGYALSGLTSGKQDFTFVYWVKPDTQSDFLSGYHSERGREIELGTLRRKTASSWGWHHKKSSSEILAERWNHIAFTASDSNFRLYVNGQLESEKKLTGRGVNDISELSLWFGALNNKGVPSHFLSGQMDNIQIWQRKLTQSEIRKSMNEPDKVSPKGMLAFYDFDSSKGNWVLNRQTGKYDLLLAQGAKLADAPVEKDSDGDGLPDWMELGLCLDPNNSDTDDDGIADGHELGMNSPYSVITDPCSPDSDTDGIPDLFEQQNGMNPIEADVNQVQGGHSVTNWVRYLQWLESKFDVENVPIIEGNRELNLSGNQGYAISGYHAADKPTTIMMWIKLDDLNKPQFSGLINDSKEFILGFGRYNDVQVNWGGDELRHRRFLEVGNWIHVALTRSENQTLLYINGEIAQKIEKGSSGIETLDNLFFGAVKSQYEVVHHIGGYLDELQIWNSALEQSQIRKYMVIPPENSLENLMAYYDFSVSKANLVLNKVSNKFDLLLVNGAHLTKSEVIQDADRDGISDEVEGGLCTDPYNPDSDSDGLPDGKEYIGWNVGDALYTSNPCDDDTDLDGMPDLFEHNNKMNPSIADTYKSDPVSGSTYWNKYTEYAEKKDIKNGIGKVNNPGILDLSNNNGFAITGLYSDEKDTTFMYWYKSEQNSVEFPNLQMSGVTDRENSYYFQESGLVLGSSHRSNFEGVWGRGVVSAGENYKSIYSEWNHIAIVIKDHTRFLYVNGQLVDETVTWWTLATRANKFYPFPIFLGAANFEGKSIYHMNGYVDNVMYWEKPLSQPEIRRIMITPDSNQTDLIAHYDFNDYRGDWVKNQATGNYDLLLKDQAVISDEPAFSDQDKDGLDDRFEHSNCLSSDNADSDGDGLLDGEEYGINTDYPYISDPCSWDTDNDGMSDGYEVSKGLNTNINDSYSTAPNSGKNHWQEYIEYIEQKNIQNKVQPVVASRLLDLENNNGFARTGIFPKKGSMTFMFWLKLNDVTVGQNFGVRDGNHNRLSIEIWWKQIFSNIGKKVIRGPVLEETDNGKWMHIAVTYNGKEQKLYVNGENKWKKRYGQDLLDFIRPIYIGSSNDNGVSAHPMNGRIDDFHYWERELTSREIKKYILNPPMLNEDGLIAYYDFTHSLGNMVRNEVTQKYDLQLNDGALLTVQPADTDIDKDGLVDRLENAFCTDGLVADTDGDGLADGVELGVNDPFTIVTDPCDYDTDKDGMDDGYEKHANTDGALPDADFDSDADGEINWYEFAEYESSQISTVIEEERTLKNSASLGYAISPVFPYKGNMTFSYWIRTDNPEMQMSGMFANNEGFYSGLSKERAEYKWGNDYRRNYVAKDKFVLGEWVNVAVVVNDSRVQMYINNRLFSDTYRREFKEKPIYPLWLGALNENGIPKYLLDGEMDNVSIWNRALTKRELFKYSVVKPEANEEGLLAYYDFTRSKGDWSLNLANNNYDLKMVGSANLSTNKNIGDTDNDGIEDRFEIASCLDPNSSDTDADGIEDKDELNFKQASNPCDPDTDGDLLPDGFELEIGSDLNSADTYEVQEGYSESNWRRYIRWKDKKDISNNINEEVEEAALSLGEIESKLSIDWFPSGENRTLAYWLKLHDLYQEQVLGSHDGNNNRFYLGIKKNNRLFSGIGNSYTEYTEISINPEMWFHLAVTYDVNSKMAKFYVDGVLVDTKERVEFKGKSINEFYIGKTNHFDESASWPIKGYIDELQIWEKALSQNEILQAMYLSPDIKADGLEYYYDFDKSKNGWVFNLAKDSFDLKLNGGAVLEPSINLEDKDEDDIPDWKEIAGCLDAENKDTDGDEMSDYSELGIYGVEMKLTNPCISDVSNTELTE